MGTFPNTGKTAIFVVVTFKYPQPDVKYEGVRKYEEKPCFV